MFDPFDLVLLVFLPVWWALNKLYHNLHGNKLRTRYAWAAQGALLFKVRLERWEDDTYIAEEPLIDRILHRLPHKHESLKRDGVGTLLVCHSRNRVLSVCYRRDEQSTVYWVPKPIFKQLVECESWEQVMALLRVAGTA